MLCQANLWKVSIIILTFPFLFWVESNHCNDASHIILVQNVWFLISCKKDNATMACVSGTFELNRPLQLSQILFRPNWPFQKIFSKYISKIECQNTFQREILLLDLLASHLLKECLPNLATPASVSSSSFQHWKAERRKSSEIGNYHSLTHWLTHWQG